MNFVSLIMLLVRPILGRALVALGFSVLTITGVAASIASLKTAVLSSFAIGGADMLGLAGLAGAWVALGAVFGAMTFAVTMFGLRKAVSMVGVGS